MSQLSTSYALLYNILIDLIETFYLSPLISFYPIPKTFSLLTLPVLLTLTWVEHRSITKWLQGYLLSQIIPFASMILGITSHVPKNLKTPSIKEGVTCGVLLKFLTRSEDMIRLLGSMVSILRSRECLPGFSSCSSRFLRIYVSVYFMPGFLGATYILVP